MRPRWYLGLIFLSTISANASMPKLQVLMGKSLSEIQISGANITKTYKHRPFLKKYSGEQTLTLDCQKKLASNSWNQRPLFASISSDSGILQWKKNKYQGEFFVVRSNGKPGCDLIHEVSLEHYISTLVAREMHRDWPLEALKAQAVAARTYALSKQQERSRQDDSGQFFDVENSEKDQVSGDMSDVTANTHQAAYLTQGEVILNKNGSLVPAFYHSKCGGKTHMPEQVWGNQVDGYKSIECPFCHSKGQASWNYKSSQKSMVNQLLNLAWPKNPYKKTSFPLSAIKFFSHGPNDQLVYFNFHDQILSVRKAQIRKVIGRNKISSTNFSINWTPYFVSFSGEGLGHGVGMCQIGAYELAKRGYNYRQILSFYYPDFQVKNYY